MQNPIQTLKERFPKPLFIGEIKDIMPYIWLSKNGWILAHEYPDGDCSFELPASSIEIEKFDNAIDKDNAMAEAYAKFINNEINEKELSRRIYQLRLGIKNYRFLI